MTVWTGAALLALALALARAAAQRAAPPLAELLAVQVRGCGRDEVNERYHCLSESVCVLPSALFRVVRASALRNGTVQHAWYIVEEAGPSPRKLYGALEVDSSPPSTRAWRNLQNATAETGMSASWTRTACSACALDISLLSFLRKLKRFGSDALSDCLSQCEEAARAACASTPSGWCAVLRCDDLRALGRAHSARRCYIDATETADSPCWLAAPALVEQALLFALFQVHDFDLFGRIGAAALAPTCAAAHVSAAIQVRALIALARVLVADHAGIPLGPGDRGEASVAELLRLCRRLQATADSSSAALHLEAALLRASPAAPTALVADWELAQALVADFISAGTLHFAAHRFLAAAAGAGAAAWWCPVAPSPPRGRYNVAVLSCLANWFAALAQEERRALVANERAAQLFVRLVSETMGPVVLVGEGDEWSAEVAALRHRGRALLQALLETCLMHDCGWGAALMSGLGRGLFLQAYLGAPLLGGLLPEADRHDWAVGAAALRTLRNDWADGEGSPVASELHGPLTVAFVSYSFNRHSVGRLLARVICGLGDRGVSIVLVTDRTLEPVGFASTDDVNAVLQRCVAPALWVHFPPGASAAGLSLRLRGLGVQAAVFADLQMQASLLAWAHRTRIAPVQIVFWGHPFTTSDGAHFDYFITSVAFEPPMDRHGRSDHFAEQLVAFDTLSFALASPQPMQRHPPIGHAEMDVDILRWLGREAVTLDGEAAPVELYRALSERCEQEGEALRLYGVLQLTMKLHPLFDRALASLTESDKCAVVVLTRNLRQRGWQQRLQDRMLHGPRRMDAQRLIFVRQLPHQLYARLLCHMDVSMDPFPFGGGVTLSDAVACGCAGDGSADDTDFVPVPFITAGALQTVHRIGAGIAALVNNSDLAAHVGCSAADAERNRGVIPVTDECIDQYVDEAIRLARTTRRRKAVAATSRRECAESKALFLADEVVEEWYKFLLRVTMGP